MELSSPPPRRWQSASGAQRLGAALLLLADAVLLAAHVLLLRDSPQFLLAAASSDITLAALLWLRPRVGVWLVLVRAAVGLFLAWTYFNADDIPLLLLPQVVLGVSMPPLLAHRLKGPVWLVAAPGPALYAALWLGMLFSLYTASAPIQFELLRFQGQLEPQPVSLVEGQAERYTLPLAGGSWYSYSAAQRSKTGADAALFNPSLGMDVAVFVQRVPGISGTGMDILESKLRMGVNDRLPGFQWGESRELPGPWDEGRMVHLRGKAGGFMREAVLAIYIWGDQLFLLEANSLSWRFQDRTRLLEELVSALHYEPPPRPFLSAEVAQRVARATVLVRTSYGTGSGFIVKDKDAYYVLTNQHVVRGDDERKVAEGIHVLFPGDQRGVRAAKVQKTERRLDMALLRLPVMGTPIPALPLRVALPARETPVVASGYPFGEQFQLGFVHPQPTFNSGTVLEPSAPPPDVYPNKSARIILTDLRLNPGNSGGPVVDLEGAVVGMVVASYLGSETSFIIPTDRLIPFAGKDVVRTLEGQSPTSPSREREAERFPESVREALRAATVSVRHGSRAEVGVLLDAPGFGKGLVLTPAPRAGPGAKVEVDFFTSASPSPLTRPGTVRATERHKNIDLALVEVEDVPGLPRGLPLQQSSRLKETDPLVLSGFRDTLGVRTPMYRYGFLAGIERAERWRYGVQVPEWLRVDMATGGALHPGPAVDREGALVGFVTLRAQSTNITELIASERIREMLVGRVRSVAARAWRDGTGGCMVEFFVDAPGPLSPPRTVSLAVDTPALPLEGDTLVPSFGPEHVLGTLEHGDSIFRLTLPSCPGSRLIYRLQLTSALTVQAVEGHLPLPARALERTQAMVPLPPLDKANWALNGFMEWKGEATRARAPETLEEALKACATSSTACGFLKSFTVVGAARARMLKTLQTSCRKGQAPACIGWAEGVEPAPAVARPDSRRRPLPPAASQNSLAEWCDGGLPEACSRLGRFLMQPGEEENWRVAAFLLRKGCTRDGTEGCSGLEGVLAEEQGAALNKGPLVSEERDALTLGCEGGLAEACTRLGGRLLRHAAWEDSKAAERKDWTEAAEALRKGCLGGSAEGCSGLAGLLAVGHGVPQDVELSLRMYRQACRLHHSVACMDAGFLHQGPFAQSGDRASAYETFRQACVLGLRQGCLEMLRAMEPVADLSGGSPWP